MANIYVIFENYFKRYNYINFKLLKIIIVNKKVN